MIKSDVYARRGVDEMTRSAFYLVVGAVLSWGFVLTGIVSELSAEWKPDNIWVFLGVGLGIPLLGILLSTSSNAFISFVGFHMVVVPFGIILGPVLYKIEVQQPGLVTQAAYLTGGVTATMAVSGLIFPKFYESIGGALFGALIALVVVGLVGLFVPALREMTIIHYIAAGIFALYIGYDMWRASSIPATLDNAVDVCVSLYLDIINLFLRILLILSKSRQS